MCFEVLRQHVGWGCCLYKANISTIGSTIAPPHSAVMSVASDARTVSSQAGGLGSAELAEVLGELRELRRDMVGRLEVQTQEMQAILTALREERVPRSATPRAAARPIIPLVLDGNVSLSSLEEAVRRQILEGARESRLAAAAKAKAKASSRPRTSEIGQNSSSTAQRSPYPEPSRTAARVPAPSREFVLAEASTREP